MPLLNHIKRAYWFIAQSSLWILFGLCGILIGFLVLPLAVLLVRDRRRRQYFARKLLWLSFRLFVWLACRMRLITCAVSGKQHFQPASGQLILANHPSLIDVVILISLFPQIDCVIKEAIIRNPVLGMAARSANYISNGESAEILDTCVARLQSGANLLLFPEGTRSVPGEALKFKAGAAEVARRIETSILPVVIDCFPQVLAKGQPWYYIPPHPPHFEIRILPPVSPHDLVIPELGPRQTRHRLNGALRELFEAEIA